MIKEPNNNSEKHLAVLVKDITLSFLRFPIIRYRIILDKWESASGKGRLRLQLEARRGEAIEAAPQQAVDEHDNGGHDERRSEQHIEAAGVAGAADGAAESRGRNDSALEMKIFRDDAGVPGAARSGHHAGDEIRKNAGQDEKTPAIPGAETIDLRGFLKVGGNGHGAGDDVEEDVPLRAEEHQEHGGDLEAAAEAKQKKKNNREERRGRNGSRHLHEGLRNAGQARIRTDGDASGNGPERAEDERGVDTQKSQRGAFQKLVIVLAVKTGQFADRVTNGKPQTGPNTRSEQIADPAAQAVLLRSGKSFRGAASANSEDEREPTEEGAKDESIQANDDGSAADKIEQRGLPSAGTFDLLKLELVRASD